MELKINNRESPVLSREFLVLISLLLFFLYSLSRTLISNVGIGNNFIGYTFLLLSYFTLLLQILRARTPSLKKAVTFIVSVAILLLFSQLLHPENGNVLTKGIAPQYGIAILLFVCSFDNPRSLYDSIILYGFISLISCFVCIIPYIKNGGYWIVTYAGEKIYTSYNMTLGYNASLAALIFWVVIKKNGKKAFLFIPIICFVLSLTLGSRGSLMCFLFFACFSLLSTPMSKRKALSILFFFSMASLLLFIGMESIIAWVSDTFEQLGLPSRTLSMLADNYSGGEMSSGRSDMWRIIIKKIIEKPFLGYGAFGDRHVLSYYYSNADSLYSHNIILELWASFGIIFGSVFFLWLIKTLAKTWSVLKGTSLFKPFICLLSYNIANLLVSNTFWYSTAFWFLIGICIVALNNPQLESTK